MNEELLRLWESEFHLADIVWENEPVQSSELVRLCNEKLGWKKSTTCTKLKKMVVKGVLINENLIVRSCVLLEQVVQNASRNIVEKTFGGSLQTICSTSCWHQCRASYRPCQSKTNCPGDDGFVGIGFS